jgi:hypothetical protein
VTRPAICKRHATDYADTYARVAITQRLVFARFLRPGAAPTRIASGRTDKGLGKNFCAHDGASNRSNYV